MLTALQESSRSHSGGRGRARLRQMLLALEVGLTVVLLIGAGLLLRSYQQLPSADLGFAQHKVLTMEINLPKNSYSNDAAVWRSSNSCSAAFAFCRAWRRRAWPPLSPEKAAVATTCTSSLSIRRFHADRCSMR